MGVRTWPTLLAIQLVHWRLSWLIVGIIKSILLVTQLRYADKFIAYNYMSVYIERNNLQLSSVTVSE